jgi:hypothetical protein
MADANTDNIVPAEDVAIPLAEPVAIPLAEPVAIPLAEPVASEVAPLVPTHPIDDPDLQEAYQAIYAVVDDIVENNGVNVNNIAYIIKAVMETIDAMGKYVSWDSRTKEDKAKELLEHVLEDLHKKGKVDNRTYEDLTMALGYLSSAIFLLTILADKGKVLLQSASGAIQRSCVRCSNRRSELRLLNSAEKERMKQLRGMARGKLQARGNRRR